MKYLFTLAFAIFATYSSAWETSDTDFWSNSNILDERQGIAVINGKVEALNEKIR